MLLVVLALVRAEQGVAELQGRSRTRSQIFHLAPATDGTWSFSLVGLQGRIPSDLVVYQGERPVLLSSAELSAQVRFWFGEIMRQIETTRGWR